MKPGGMGCGKRAWFAVLILMLAVAFAFVVRNRTRPGIETIATGLNQPRGMAFDAAGNLLVTEAGVVDDQPDAIVEPLTNHSGRVLRIAPNGRITPLVTGLPFTNYAVAGDVGATDIVALRNAVYVLTGEGYDDALSRAVLRVVPDKPPQRVANLLSFAFSTTPAADQLAAGAVPSNPFAMVAGPDDGTFYVTDGASGLVVSVTHEGTMRVFATIPDMAPLTGLSFGPDGRLYVAMFSTLPVTQGGGAVWAAAVDGVLTRAIDNLTMPIDVAFDSSGTMFVLEFSDGVGRLYAPDRGRLLRIEPDGARTVVLDKLNFPTSMTFSDQGDLYIALSGAFSGSGEGKIIKVPRRRLQ